MSAYNNFTATLPHVLIKELQEFGSGATTVTSHEAIADMLVSILIFYDRFGW